MKSRTFAWAARITALLVLTVSVNARAQSWANKTFRGVIDGYTPQTTTGPYEMHGPWCVKVRRDGKRADFYAALNMELSDGWVITKNNYDFTPSQRGAHTHHITLGNAEVTPIANGFELTGKASFTLNGGPAPTTVAPSDVVITITGGSDIEYSNFSLTFVKPGSNHFGPLPIPGVVKSVKEEGAPPKGER